MLIFKYMAIKITITEEEILNTSNNYLLGETIRNKYWQVRKALDNIKFDDDNILLDVNEDGIITSLGHLE